MCQRCLGESPSVSVTDTALEVRCNACYWVRVTVRQAVLPIVAVVILGAGVYLFFAVRGQPAPPEISKAPEPSQPVASGAPPRAHKRPTPTPPPPPTDNSAAVPVVTGVPQVIIGPPIDREAALEGPKLDAVMDEANKAYDRGDFESAKTLAGRVLGRDSTNVRMLRIMVSASCQDGDTASAQTHYRNLPPGDQAQMRTRCARYGVTFADNP